MSLGSPHLSSMTSDQGPGPVLDISLRKQHKVKNDDLYKRVLVENTVKTIQEEINRKMEVITDKFPDLFTGLGRAKVEPVHIEVDPRVKPIQQKRRNIALHYVDRLKKHLNELKKEGVISGPLGPEWAKGWICNPVITGKKWDKERIRVNLDTRTMKDAVKTSKFPIPTVAELRHEFRGSDRYSVLDMNHAFHQFSMTEESKKLFVFYTPWASTPSTHW